MRITHPQSVFQGIPPEDMFFVANDQQIQMGTGFVIRFMQFEMYPERPQHLFLQIDAQPSARALLFGALLARSEQLRALTPNIPARLYAQLQPTDDDMLKFYEKCGFRADDSEDMYRFSPTEGVAHAPMGMKFASVALNDDASLNSFLTRINQYRIQPIDRDYLMLWMQQQHFLALGFYHGNMPVCEAVFTGAGDQVTLTTLYTHAQYRRQGLATQMIGAASSILRERGVEVIYTHIFRRNAPQSALMKRVNGVFIRPVTLLPGVDI